MSFDIVNLLTIVSCIVAIVVSYNFAADYIATKKQQNHVVDNSQLGSENSEYEKILDATYWLEHERQKNQGEHFEDETIFLNRAKAIRTSTAFFSFINE